MYLHFPFTFCSQKAFHPRTRQGLCDARRVRSRSRNHRARRPRDSTRGRLATRSGHRDKLPHRPEWSQSGPAPPGLHCAPRSPGRSLVPADVRRRPHSLTFRRWRLIGSGSGKEKTIAQQQNSQNKACNFFQSPRGRRSQACNVLENGICRLVRLSEPT